MKRFFIASVSLVAGLLVASQVEAAGPKGGGGGGAKGVGVGGAKGGPSMAKGTSLPKGPSGISKGGPSSPKGIQPKGNPGTQSKGSQSYAKNYHLTYGKKFSHGYC